MHHSSTTTYVPNFIDIEETFRGQTDVRTYAQTDGEGRTFKTGVIRSIVSKSRPKNDATDRHQSMLKLKLDTAIVMMYM